MDTPDLVEHSTTCAPNHVIVPQLLEVGQRYPAADPFVVHYSSARLRVNVADVLEVSNQCHTGHGVRMAMTSPTPANSSSVMTDIATLAGDSGRTLKLLIAAIPHWPGSLALVRAVGRVVADLGYSTKASDLLERTAQYSIENNRPLEALAAICQLSTYEHDTEELASSFIAHYAAGSDHLVVGTTSEYPLPTGPLPTELPEGADSDELDALVDEALAVCGGAIQSRPGSSICSPIPLISDLESKDLISVVEKMELTTLPPNTVLYEATQQLPGIWWLVDGEIEVGTEQSSYAAIAPGSILGFEALLGKPSYLRATTVSACEMLFLSLKPIAALLRRKRFRARIEAVAARYEVHRAIGRSELFRALPPEEHAGFMSRFIGYQIPEGSTLVRQGRKSPGLFLITWGEVELVSSNGSANGPHDLGVGEVVGLSGMSSEIARYSVVTSTRLRALFLDSADVAAALEQHPSAEPVLETLYRRRLELFEK